MKNSAKKPKDFSKYDFVWEMNYKSKLGEDFSVWVYGNYDEDTPDEGSIIGYMNGVWSDIVFANPDMKIIESLPHKE